MNIEFKSLSKDSILQGTSPEELASFSNKVFIHDTSVKCPYWFAVMNGALGLGQRDSENRRLKATNVMALATSALARHRNNKLSAFAYRISLVLFNSGVSYYDTTRLNHLGICMSSWRMLHLQKIMGYASDSKVIIWKKSIEEIYSAVRFLQHIKKEQVPERKEEDMDIDTVICIDEDRLQSYSGYSKATYTMCKELINDAMIRREEKMCYDSTLDDVIYFLQTKRIPHYRLVYCCHLFVQSYFN
jgi:hypothetical protein